MSRNNEPMLHESLDLSDSGRARKTPVDKSLAGAAAPSPLPAVPEDDDECAVLCAGGSPSEIYRHNRRLLLEFAGEKPRHAGEHNRQKHRIMICGGLDHTLCDARPWAAQLAADFERYCRTAEKAGMNPPAGLWAFFRQTGLTCVTQTYRLSDGRTRQGTTFWCSPDYEAEKEAKGRKLLREWQALLPPDRKPGVIEAGRLLFAVVEEPSERRSFGFYDACPAFDKLCTQWIILLANAKACGASLPFSSAWELMTQLGLALTSAGGLRDDGSRRLEVWCDESQAPAKIAPAHELYESLRPTVPTDPLRGSLEESSACARMDRTLWQNIPTEVRRKDLADWQLRASVIESRML